MRRQYKKRQTWVVVKVVLKLFISYMNLLNVNRLDEVGKIRQVIVLILLESFYCLVISFNTRNVVFSRRFHNLNQV